jgi:hypothetical protein
MRVGAKGPFDFYDRIECGQRVRTAALRKLHIDYPDGQLTLEICSRSLPVNTKSLVHVQQ